MTAALARRVGRARFEQHNTFEDFDFTLSPKLPAAMLNLRWELTGHRVGSVPGAARTSLM